MGNSIDKVRTYITYLVSTIWGLAAIDGALTKDWTGLGIVTPVMMLVGAFLFAYKTAGDKQRTEEYDRRFVKDDLSDF